MFEKRRKVQEVRESLLDTDELARIVGEKQIRNHKQIYRNTAQDGLANIFERFVDQCVESQDDDAVDGHFHLYEGGLNTSKTGALNKSLNQSLDQGAKLDEETHNRLKEEYYSSLLNKSPTRLEALDLFLLLDHENDQFLKYGEIKTIWKYIEKLGQGERGEIKSEQDLESTFESFGKYQMDRTTFNQFVDKAGFNVAKVRDKLYSDSAYGGCCAKIFCACCRCCNRIVRKKMVQGMIKKEDELIRMYVYDEEPKTSKMQDVIALGLAILQAKSEVAHHITDVLLCSEVYWTGMRPENRQLWSYKFATVYIFLCLTSVYLIAYSSMINMLLFKGVYEPQVIKRNSCCQVTIKIVFLSFLGPLYFVGVELVSKTMAVCASLGMLTCGRKGYLAARIRFLRLIDFVFSLNEEQIDGLNKQRGVVQLLFESLPMVILQLLIRKGYVPCEALIKESQFTLFLSLVTCLINVLVNSFMIYTESRALTEPFLEYVLNSFKARQGWIPFMLQIERKELKQAVDFGEVKCSYPLVTGPTCVYKTFKFQFSDTSLQVLTSALVKWDTTTMETADLLIGDSDEDDAGEHVKQKGGRVKLLRAKYIMDLGTSLSHVSVNVLLHFYHLSPRKRIWIKLSHLNWKELITNSKKSHLIYKPKNSELMQARTPSGIHLLWICVEDEKAYNPTSTQLYEEQLGIRRRFKIIQTALKTLTESIDNHEGSELLRQLDEFARSYEEGTFDYIEKQVRELIIVQNRTMLRDLGRLAKKGNRILDQCQEFILANDLPPEGIEQVQTSEESVRPVFEQLEEAETDVKTFLETMDAASLKLDEFLVVIKQEVSNYDLDDHLKEQVEELKARCDNAKLVIKGNKETIKEKLRNFLDSVPTFKNIYGANKFLTQYKGLRQELHSMQQTLRYEYSTDRYKNQLVEIIYKYKNKEEEGGEQAENVPENEERETFVYEPNEADHIDVMFAKIYKDSEGGKLPVKFLRKALRDPAWRVYQYGPFEIICEAWGGADKAEKCYMLQHLLNEDTREHASFFKRCRDEMVKYEAWDKLDKISVTGLVGQSLKFKVENAPILQMAKQLMQLIVPQKGLESNSLRYSDLFKQDLVNDLDFYFEKYQSLLPPLDDLTFMTMDEVKEFNDPNAWMIQKCMKELIFVERCDPNIMDNYGQTLLNFAIKEHKQHSIRYMIESKHVKVNEPNRQGITPIGQAFISRNVKAIKVLLKEGANIHAKCVIDRFVTRKMMTPLHYFIKRIRVRGLHKTDEAILQILLDNYIKAVNNDEKVGLVRQLCRMFATKNFKENPEMIISKFLLPFMNKGDINLLEFKDQKDNNALHLFFKGKMKDQHNFLSKHIYDYMPEDLDMEQKVEGVRKLLNKKNNYELEKNSPFEIAFEGLDEHMIRAISRDLVDKFDQIQQKIALDYIFIVCHVNYDHFFFRGTPLEQLVEPLYKHFEDEQKVKDTLFEMAENEKPAPEVRVFQNLHHRLRIGPYIEKRNAMGYSESRSFQRDTTKELQQVMISKSEDKTKDKQGQFMRYVKQKSIGFQGNLQALLKNEISAKVQDSSISKKKVKEQPPNPYFEFAFTLILELIALFDMFGDIYLLLGMYEYGHTAWFTLSIFTMLSPFYVCYVPLVTFQKNRGKLQKETQFLKFLNILSLTPFIVAYLLLMDVIYIVVSVVITPIAYIIKLLTCGLIDMTNVEEKLDVLYEILFGMSDMDIKGFRRLRTISQLSFESLPQIILQIRILLYALNGDNKLGVSLDAIVASLGCAVLHAFFEMIFVYLEAVSCKTTVIHYFIVCFNARFGWIPFVNFFSSLAGFDEDAGDQQEDLNYEGMKSQICGIKFQMHFRFSNSSCATLITSLSNLRDEKDPKKRMDLKIGASLNDVDFVMLMDLMIIASSRINLDISEVDLLEMIKRDKETMKELTTKKSEEEAFQQGYLIQKVANIGQSSVIAVMLDIDGVVLDFKPSLLDIARATKNYDIAKLIVNSKNFHKELAKVEDNLCYMYKLIEQELKEEKNPIIQASLFSNPNIIVPEQYQYLLLMQVTNYLLAKDFRNAHLLYQHVFGCMAKPKYLLRGVGDLITTRAVDYQAKEELFNSVVPLIEEFTKKFPKKLFFYESNKANADEDDMQLNFMSTEVASYFAVVRDLVIRHWDVQDLGLDYLGSENNPFDLAPFKIDAKTLLIVSKLLTADHHLVTCLKPQEVAKCDQVVQALALDKYRATYFYRSRQNDQTGSLYHIEIAQADKISLDDEDAARKPEFGTTIVVVKERFAGATHTAFSYKLPPEVLAVRRFQIQFQYFGGSIQLNHLSAWHQSSFEISNEHLNAWETQTYVEEFSEREEDMLGFKDIISSATGGDTIQIWLQTNGYAFSQGVLCEFDVILKDGAQLKLTPVVKKEEKSEEQKPAEAAEGEQ